MHDVWSDASGLDRRIAFVAWVPMRISVGKEWTYSFAKLHDHVWDQLCFRGDHQTQFGEYVVFALYLATVQPRGCKVLSWTDNNYVVGAV